MTTAKRIDGADISHWQSGTLNLAAAKKAGLKWIAHKATQGTDYTDPNFAKRRSQAKTAKVPFLAYHYATNEGTATAQAKHFLAVAKPVAGDLRPMLDLEDKSMASWSTAKKTAWVKEFVGVIKAATGVPPFIYTRWNLTSNFDCPLWVARYSNTNAAPKVPAPWKAWTVWQFSDGIYGVPKSVAGLGNVDLNTVNMTPAKFLSTFTLAAKPAPKPTPKPAPAPQHHTVTSPGAAKSVLLFADTNENLRTKAVRDYYAETFPGSRLCWDARMPALNTHDTRLIDGAFIWGGTITDPYVMAKGKPKCLDHNPIRMFVTVGGKQVRAVYHSLNNKRTASGGWQAPTETVVPWLVQLSRGADILACDEASSPNLAPRLRAALGKGWEVRHPGEFLVAVRTSVVQPKQSGMLWKLSSIVGLAAWRDDHAGGFECVVNGHPLLVIVNHAPADLSDAKQAAAHTAGDKALAAKIKAWLA